MPLLGGFLLQISAALALIRVLMGRSGLFLSVNYEWLSFLNLSLQTNPLERPETTGALWPYHSREGKRDRSLGLNCPSPRHLNMGH